MSFNDLSLDPRILAGVKSAGYTIPTPIQEQAIPAILEGKDLLGLAQTGTGKTAAFLLPIFQRLMQYPTRKVRALILAPTRELAEQIHQAAIDLGKHTGVRSVAIYGGVSKRPQLAALRRGPEIVVACPGRLLDHMGENDIDLSQVEVLVLDEADTMCDMGFMPDTKRVIQKLPARRQTLFFSATMSEEIRQLSRSLLSMPVTVRINANAPAHTVSHALYPVPDALKRKLLLALLQQTATGKVMIFTRTKHRAKTLARMLEAEKFRVAELQGNLSQNRRQQAMEGFRTGKFDLLVATDIAAHGIDVSEVSHVLNFDIPDTVDAYTHRIGRTGRALHNGEAFTLATPEDASVVRAVERTLQIHIERRALPGFDYGDFSPQQQFSQQTPGQSGPGRPKPNGRRPNSPAPRHNGPGRPGNRPPVTGDRQQSPVGSVTRRGVRPSDIISHASPNRNGTGRPGNRPSEAGDRQQSPAGTVTRRGVRPSDYIGHASPDRNTGPGRKSAPAPGSGRPRTSGNGAGNASGSRHPRSRRPASSGASSR